MTIPTAPRRLTLDALQEILRREVTEHAHLGGLRGFNHQMVDELGKVRPLAGCALLDLGASVHGYALEAALLRGVSLYEGVDLDITRHWGAPEVEVTALDGSVGRLRQRDAEDSGFAADSFDSLLSISTFEHFHHPDTVLREMHRVLRPGGVVLVSTEPIWTASYGHHLHHFGAISDLVPPWSHLFLSKDQLRAVLARQTWPADAPIDREAALHWIYDGGGVNRHDIHRLKAYFEQSPFDLDWLVQIPDELTPERTATAAYVARLLPYTADELLSRGLSLVLRKR